MLGSHFPFLYSANCQSLYSFSQTKRFLNSIYAEMSPPTDEEVRKYIVSGILKGVQNIEKKLQNDVKDMCERVLLPLVEECKTRTLNRDVRQRLKQSFKDIYRSLKLHLKFHLRAEPNELNKLGQEIGLTREELDPLPWRECAIDPGSKLLEIVSTI